MSACVRVCTFGTRSISQTTDSASARADAAFSPIAETFASPDSADSICDTDGGSSANGSIASTDPHCGGDCPPNIAFVDEQLVDAPPPLPEAAPDPVSDPVKRRNRLVDPLLQAGAGARRLYVNGRLPAVSASSDGRFYCPQCNCKHTKLNALRLHMKECGQMFGCILCGSVYKQSRTYRQHVRDKHGGGVATVTAIARSVDTTVAAAPAAPADEHESVGLPEHH